MVAEGNVGLAFGLVGVSAAASMAGALPLLWTSKARPKFVAGSLGFAAGLMIFVALSEILIEGSIASLEEAGHSRKASTRYGIMLFFAGCSIVLLLDLVLECISPLAKVPMIAFTKSWARLRSRKQIGPSKGSEEKQWNDEPSKEGNLESGELSDQSSDVDIGFDAKLKRTSALVAISLAVHNFPEGIGVFVGALHDSKFGASIAIAIAIHNIPEGLCISIPVFFATGKKWKAVLWTAIPSLAEPLGGLLAYLFFHDASSLAFGITFGIVSGIMVYVAVMELVPAALKYDPKHHTVTISIMIGMVIMGISLILLTL